MDLYSKAKVLKMFVSNRVLKTTENGLMFYHVFDLNGRKIAQLAVPFNGLGLHELRLHGYPILCVNWRPEYDKIGVADNIRNDKNFMDNLILLCDRGAYVRINTLRRDRRTR